MVGESDVVLDEDRVLEPKTRLFFPTFTEWVVDGNAEQVLRSVRDLVGDQAIFGVPEKFTLFVTSAWVSAVEEDNVSIHSFASIGKIQGTKVTDFVGGWVDHVAGQHGGNMFASLSFPMPLRVETGERIWVKVQNFSLGLVSAGFQGFILPKKISIR